MGASMLVVEPDPATRNLLAASLSGAGYRVSSTADVPGAEASIRQARPDFLLLDGSLPGTGALAFVRRLRADQRTRDIPVVLISSRDGENDRVEALEGGADDCLPKPVPLRELLARVKAIMRRCAPQLADDAVEVSGLRLDPAARIVTAGDRRIDLWTTEFRLLHFFMTHPGRVFGRPKLLDEVWGDHVFVEERTVDVHIRRLRQALMPTGRHELIETVRGIGYRFRPDAPRGVLPAGADGDRRRGEPGTRPQTNPA